jgi:hypothetical protein
MSTCAKTVEHEDRPGPPPQSLSERRGRPLEADQFSVTSIPTPEDSAVIASELSVQPDLQSEVRSSAGGTPTLKV